MKFKNLVVKWDQTMLKRCILVVCWWPVSEITLKQPVHGHRWACNAKLLICWYLYNSKDYNNTAWPTEMVVHCGLTAVYSQSFEFSSHCGSGNALTFTIKHTRLVLLLIFYDSTSPFKWSLITIIQDFFLRPNFFREVDGSLLSFQVLIMRWAVLHPISAISFVVFFAWCRPIIPPFWNTVTSFPRPRDTSSNINVEEIKSYSMHRLGWNEFQLKRINHSSAYFITGS